MKISKKELIKLLSEHLGSEEDSISSQVDKLIADIQKSIKKGEKFSINGFGDFVIENGFLTFRVATVFATEINYNYEGLMPVDIDRPDILLPNEKLDAVTDHSPLEKSSSVIVDEAVEGEQDPFEGLDYELTDIPADEIPEQKPEIKSVDVALVDLSSLDEKIHQNQENEYLEYKVHSMDDSTDSDDIDIYELDETHSVATDLPAQGDNKAQKIDEDNGDKGVDSVKEAELVDHSSLGKLLTIAAVIFIIALFGGGSWWFLIGPAKTITSSDTQSVERPSEIQPVNSVPYNQIETVESIPMDFTEDDLEQLTSTTAQAGNLEEKPITQIQSVGIMNETADSSRTTRTREPNTSIGQTESVDSTQINPTFGINGLVQDLQGKVFSIIVHSLPSRQAALIECEKISQENLRCLVREASSPQGRITYRVGIGQFATVDAAQSEIVKLPEPFKSRNFIVRIN